MSDEIPLHGGNTNDAVVRIDNTVRRVQTSYSESVHELLLHLEKSDYPSSPRFMGVDEKDREILGFIEGDTGSFDFLWQENETLIAVARMLRVYHKAVEPFSYTHLNWAYSYPDIAAHELICHNDFAPYNMAFRKKLPVGIFDFDLAGPGPRLRDVAYAAYWSVPLSFNSQDMCAAASADLQSGCQRLKMFCEAYGTSNYFGLLSMLREVLVHMSSRDTMVSMLGAEVANKLEQAGHIQHWRQELIVFDKYRPAIASRLR